MSLRLREGSGERRAPGTPEHRLECDPARAPLEPGRERGGLELLEVLVWSLILPHAWRIGDRSLPDKVARAHSPVVPHPRDSGMPATPPFRILAQTAPGLEPLLVAELEALGIRPRPLIGGAEWEGGWTDLFAANLHLRTAGRVLVEIASFRARALGELERKAGASGAGAFVPAGPLDLRVSCSRSRLSHRRAVEERVRRALGRPPDEAPEGATRLLVRIHRDEVTLRLDSSGEHLHRRGYRSRIGEAPLRETLAAAALLTVGWKGSEGPPPPLADPFCGSGTIPIEGALLAAGIPPGLARPGLAARAYAFERWPGFPAAEWQGFVEAARDRAGAVGDDPPPIVGSDRDAEVIEAARANATDAGVEALVRFEVAPFTAAPLPSLPGWIVTNPPFGGRLGDRRSLRGLYRALGRALRGPWEGWRIALFSADPALPRHLGIPLEERLSLPVGGLRLRLHSGADPRP